MERTFAVCPQGLEEAEVQVLEKSHADFRAIPPSQRITLYWLQVGLPYCSCMNNTSVKHMMSDACTACIPAVRHVRANAATL